MGTLRDQRQEEFAKIWLDSNRYGILLICPRAGKTRIALKIFKELKPASILIAYPDRKIMQSWKDEFQLCEMSDEGVTYTTHISLHKYVKEKYALVVIDEVHLLSKAQIMTCIELFKQNRCVLGLTGTLAINTAKELYNELQLNVIAEYTIEEGIKEGVISDYTINIISTSLDNIVKQYKGKTEKKKFDSYSWVIDKMENEGKDTKFLRLSRMRVLQNSVAKKNITKKLLAKFQEERVLVFCATTKIADDLGINSYHSGKKNPEIFSNFVKGKDKHLAVIRIGNSGITYTPLNMVIINSFDSNPEMLTQRINRCMSMEYDNPEKEALIYIVTSDEPVELKWLKRSLEFFDTTKINYL